MTRALVGVEEVERGRVEEGTYGSFQAESYEPEEFYVEFDAVEEEEHDAVQQDQESRELEVPTSSKECVS